jgi:hypothetical protein
LSGKRAGRRPHKRPEDKEKEMIKRTMLAAFAVALALAALPAFAAADETEHPGDPYLSETPEDTTFTVAGIGKPKLWTHDGNWFECETVTGTGEFVDDETGSIKFLFHKCHTKLGLTCTTTGLETGTIETTTLPFHLKTVVHENEHKPGVLITPNNDVTAGHFATFNCQLIGKFTIKGNGLIGTITDPEDNGTPATSMTISFVETETGSGTQTDTKVTNDETEYHLEASIGGGAFQPVSWDAEGTAEFTNEGQFRLGTTAT